MKHALTIGIAVLALSGTSRGQVSVEEAKTRLAERTAQRRATTTQPTTQPLTDEKFLEGLLVGWLLAFKTKKQEERVLAEKEDQRRRLLGGDRLTGPVKELPRPTNNFL